MIKNIFILMLFIQAGFGQKYTISGYIKEKGSQESLIGVNVYVPGTSIGTASNTYGYYSITLPAADQQKLAFSYVGFQPLIKDLKLRQNLSLDILLENANQLDEVTISAVRQDERLSETAQMSKIEVPISQIKKIPALLGEKDVLKVLQLMPGVQKGSEGQSGLYVRGGGPDQNLLILDDAVVYNASHLFGFFSVFNGDALKSVELTKGGFPARFGGRLSSVIEMNMKEGNKEKLHGEGGIGLISSRLTLEGPLKTNKASFLVSARRTYLDIVSRPLIKYQQRNVAEKTTGGYFFYDLNTKLNVDLNHKNKVYLSGYFGQDKFNVLNTFEGTESDGGLNWGNSTATLRFNHIYGAKLFSNTSLIFSKYNFQINQKSAEELEGVFSTFSAKYDSKIRDYNLKHDFDFYPNPNHAIKFGFQSIFHEFRPNALVVQAAGFTQSADGGTYDVIESGVYAEDTYTPVENLKMNVGIRGSFFKTNSKNYILPEPRLALAYKFSQSLAAKASYARMNQFVHLLSNTNVGLPNDLWVPTTDRIAPQQSQQWAAGLAKDLDKLGLGITLEGYYKTMKNILAYKEGSSFLQININPDNPQASSTVSWEDNITAGQGYSYGAELLVQKKLGAFSGWIGYTWSKTRWQFDELNFGNWFYPKYDRRHDISLVGMYDISKRITASAVWVYGTGNALTVPISQIYAPVRNVNGYFQPENQLLPDASQYFNVRRVQEYGAKNSWRGEPYHRLDVGVQFRKQKKRIERTWEVSAYNAYNRRNPYFYQIRNIRSTTDPNVRRTVFQRVSLFPIVPSVSYGFKF